VRAIQKIKETFEGQMTETCVSQILYELNGIWRAVMRKESDAVKRHYTGQVQDLRRQLVTKRAFDEEEAHKEITRLKKELQFIQRNGSAAAAKKKNGSDVAGTKENTHANAFKRPEGAEKRNEALELKNKISQLERQRLNHGANIIGPLSALS
jgi:ATPase subunit of ABC transporter with duplicated ATPase domains